MALFPELENALQLVLNKSSESQEFKERFKKLMEDTFGMSTVLDKDIRDIINLIGTTGNGGLE
jgi:hypothetical protein